MWKHQKFEGDDTQIDAELIFKIGFYGATANTNYNLALAMQSERKKAIQRRIKAHLNVTAEFIGVKKNSFAVLKPAKDDILPGSSILQ